MKTDSYGLHISQQYNLDLEELRNHVLVMGGLVEKQVSDAIQSLINEDKALAQSVVETDHDINLMEQKLDKECTRILALRQPAARDLRLIVSVSKTIIDLERIGDESKKIAKLVLKTDENNRNTNGYVETKHIGQLVKKMLHESLDAFARTDVQSCLLVVSEDSDVDQEYEAAVRQMITFMMEDPRFIKRSLNILWTLRSLERIGDHSRNIAEQVIYLVKGEDVRHKSATDIRDKIF